MEVVDTVVEAVVVDTDHSTHTLAPDMPANCFPTPTYQGDWLRIVYLVDKQ